MVLPNRTSPTPTQSRMDYADTIAGSAAGSGGGTIGFNSYPNSFARRRNCFSMRADLLRVRVLRLLHVGHPKAHHVVDNPRQLVSRGRDCLGSTQPRPLATQVSPQVTLAPDQAERSQPQREGRPVLAAADPTGLHLAARLLEVGTQPQPTGEVLHRYPLFPNSERVNELIIEGIGLLVLKIDRTGLRRTEDLSLKRDKWLPGFPQHQFIHTLGVWERG